MRVCKISHFSVLQAEGSRRHDPIKQDLEQQIAELQAALADLDRPEASHNAHN